MQSHDLVIFIKWISNLTRSTIIFNNKRHCVLMLPKFLKNRGTESSAHYKDKVLFHLLCLVSANLLWGPWSLHSSWHLITSSITVLYTSNTWEPAPQKCIFSFCIILGWVMLSSVLRGRGHWQVPGEVVTLSMWTFPCMAFLLSISVPLASLGARTVLHCEKEPQ